MALLFSYYGYFGALLVMSAVTFNLCVSASLYRPIDLQSNKKPIEITDPQLDLETAATQESQSLALAENVGIAESKGVFLLSAVGITDTVGRFSSGFIFDCHAVRRHKIFVYNVSIFLTSLTYFA